jgi:competence protein ComEC
VRTTPKDASLNTGVTCDAIGCIGRLADGRLASMALEVEAFAEDCARAAVVVSARGAPSSSCAATLVDRGVWRTHGAIALRWSGQHFEQGVTLPSGYQRPWTRVTASGRAGANQPAPRDASPRSEFLEADD